MLCTYDQLKTGRCGEHEPGEGKVVELLPTQGEVFVVAGLVLVVGASTQTALDHTSGAVVQIRLWFGRG